MDLNKARRHALHVIASYVELQDSNLFEDNVARYRSLVDRYPELMLQK